MRQIFALPLFAATLLIAGAAFAQTPSSQHNSALYESCREQAADNGLYGTFADPSIKSCMETLASAVPADHSIAACRMEAVARNVSGDGLHEFLERCTHGG
jgi:hypothetical protein